MKDCTQAAASTMLIVCGSTVGCGDFDDAKSMNFRPSFGSLPTLSSAPDKGPEVLQPHDASFW